METNYTPEPLGEPSRQFPSFVQFMNAYAYNQGLSSRELVWFIDRMSEHLPLYFLCLWQGFPEWEITRRKNMELRILLGVGPGTPEFRVLELHAEGKRLAYTKGNAI